MRGRRKTAASSCSQLRSAGSSGPARHTSMSSAPTVGRSRPRATRPTPAATAAAQTRALRRIGSPAWPGSMASNAGRASATGMISADTRRLRMPYVPPGKTSSSLADPEPLPQSANTPRRGISFGMKISSPSTTQPHDTGFLVRPAGIYSPCRIWSCSYRCHPRRCPATATTRPSPPSKTFQVRIANAKHMRRHRDCEADAELPAGPLPLYRGALTALMDAPVGSDRVS